MTTYSIAGKGSRILSRLSQAPATAQELIEAAVGESPTRRNVYRAWRTLDALRRDHLVSKPDLYTLTQEGKDALICLESGRSVTIAEAVPSVRVFGRAA